MGSAPNAAARADVSHPAKQGPVQMLSVFGGFRPVFIAVAMCFFAFTTLIGNYSYCESCYEFIINREASGAELVVIRIIASFLLLLGAVALAGLVWDIADMMQGFTNRMSGAFAANILQQGGDDDK